MYHSNALTTIRRRVGTRRLPKDAAAFLPNWRRLHHWVHALGEVLARGFPEGAVLQGARQTAQDVLAKGWRKLLVIFPLPSEMKWRESLKMQAIFLHSMLEELEHQTGAAGSQDVANRTMFVSGKRWVRANSPLVRQVRPDVNALGEVLTIALKSMNIRSRVQVTDTSVTVLNMACPLLEWAKEHQIEPNRICQTVCGEHASFFKGISYSYPVYVSYRASHMMGRGHPMCKKVFSTR